MRTSEVIVCLSFGLIALASVGLPIVAKLQASFAAWNAALSAIN